MERKSSHVVQQQQAAESCSNDGVRPDVCWSMQADD